DVLRAANAELEKRLSEALEQQSATAEMLGVISSLPADVQPVFDTIVRSFVLLCGSVFGTIYTFDGELVHFAGAYGFPPEQLAEVRQSTPSASTTLQCFPLGRSWQERLCTSTMSCSTCNTTASMWRRRAYAEYSRYRCFAKPFPWAQSC